jgi:molybdopterin-guanine dinucleotide biosynthesis protein MobB
LGFCGAADSGKTTLVCQVVTHLTGLGLRVGAIKHHGHPEPLPLGKPGKDTARLHECGAQRVALVHAGGMELIAGPEEAHGDPRLFAQRFMADMDLVLVEGYKRGDFDKIEVVAPGREPILALGGRLLALTRRGGGQGHGATEAGLPVLDANDPPAVARFVLEHVGLAPSPGRGSDIPSVTVLVRGQPLVLKPFIARMVDQTLRAMVGGLKGGEEAESDIIEVRLG